jgi:gamma-glutamylcyclotransferase (GGCT)/AIG2-like uncharacterized protein YtfP
VTRVFVYGTLLSGEPNHRLLEAARLVGQGRTRPVFTLVDVGPFPALVEGGDVAVVGEVYEVDAATLASLDRLEGHPRYYERRCIELADGSEADTYLRPVAQVAGYEVIESGCWRERQGAKP